MAVVELNDMRYSEIPRIQSTLVAKRESVGVYKGGRCARCDSIPSARASFASIPTVRRCGVKMMCMGAAIFGFSINEVAASQPFLQSDNLDASARCIVIHPLMIQLPWAGELYPPGSNLRLLPKPPIGL